MEFPDGNAEIYSLAGDELYVDARVLKWKPLGNLLGLHTEYQLDRIAGRYRAIGQERDEPRTVYPLSAPSFIDLFDLRQRNAWLAPLVDAEYGSATFIPAGDEARFDVSLSTTGLLARRISAQ